MLSVSDRMIDVKAKSTGLDVSIPHGMVVWSTGVGTRPIVKDFMEQIGQVCTFCIMEHSIATPLFPQLISVSVASFTGQQEGSSYR